MTSARQKRASAPDQYRIGLWGPPSSGKTTFLAALQLASMRATIPGNWLINGSDDESSDKLVDWVHALTRNRIFPEGTQAASEYVFRFTGEEVARRTWIRPRGSAVQDRIAFELEILDVPGRHYGHGAVPVRPTLPLDDPDVDHPRPANMQFEDELPRRDGGPASTQSEDEDQLLEHLEACHGIVFLYDPVGGKDGDRTFEHFHKILEKLTRRYFEQERFGGARLPHHVAVCISKFDQHDIYQFAKRRGYTLQDVEPPYLPRVPDDQADEFFQDLCRSNPHANADLVNNCIKKYFRNVTYFVTSAIGFYVGNGNRFRPHDALNVEPGSDGNWRIRGPVVPINVLEPVIGLHQSLRRAAR